jgi:hypothetical protein
MMSCSVKILLSSNPFPLQFAGKLSLIQPLFSLFFSSSHEDSNCFPHRHRLPPTQTSVNMFSRFFHITNVKTRAENSINLIALLHYFSIVSGGDGVKMENKKLRRRNKNREKSKKAGN